MREKQPFIQWLMLAVLFLIATFSSPLSAQAKDQIHMKTKKATIAKIFETIREQTGYRVFYSNDLLDDQEELTFIHQDLSLDNIMEQVLAGKDIQWQIKEKFIVLGEINPAKPASKTTTTTKKQDLIVSGKISDIQNNQALTGVSIKLKGSTIGTSSTVDGTFSLSLTKEQLTNGILSFSFVGYMGKEEAIRGRNTVDIALAADSSNLEEVVVVGFGTQRKVSLIGAQSTVSAEELKLPVASVTQSLAGRLAGIVGVQRSGEPGRSAADIWVRGIATFGGNSSNPLVLVDGVERSINNIDPEDIESFTVLKDASGTAVYGVRGANGVILVKTKTGKIGKPQVFFDYNEGVGTFTRRPKLADGITYLNMANEATVGRGLSPKYTQEYIDHTASGEDPLVYPNVDWFDAIFNKYSRNRRANLNVGGGVDNAQYYVSLAYYDENGLLKSDDHEGYNTKSQYQRYNFTSNLNLKITSTTKLDLGIQGYVSNGNFPGENTEDIFGAAFDVPPIEYPIMYPGDIIPGKATNGGWRNPYADLTRRGYRNEFENQIYSNLRITQALGILTEGLSATGMFAFDAKNANSLKRSKREDTYFINIEKPYNDDGTLNLERTFIGNGNYLGYDPGRSGNRKFYGEAAINYDRAFDKHRIGGLLLGYAQDYNNPFAGDFTSSIPERQLGLALRATYSYDDRYFLELNGGYNGSELFDPKNRFGFFPAIGFGWVPSNEKFFEPLKNTISFLKFRYSDGKTGIGTINGRRFAYLTLVSDGAPGYQFGQNFNNVNGISVTDYGEAISWSTSRKQDLGIEFRTLKDNLYVIFDVFKEKRSDIFLQRQSIPLFLGLENNPFGNLGVVDNRGFDATVEYNFHVGKVDIGLRGNITHTKDKILDDDRPEQPYPWMSHIGDNALARYGYIAEKLFDSEEEIQQSATPGDKSKVKPGDIKYQDLNGDGLINDLDKTRIGRGDVPATVYGFGFNLSYKGFAISTLFQGIHDADVLLGGSAIIPFNGGGGISNVYANITDRWTPENPNQDVFYPRLAYGEDQNFNNAQPSTWWIKDVSFLRLKSAQISYNLPREWTSRFGIKNAAIYLIGLNIFTFSDFKLWDPELTNVNNDGARTSNGNKYPLTRTLSLGVNLKF